MNEMPAFFGTAPPVLGTATPLALAKSHLRLGSGLLDSYVQSLLAGAESWVAEYAGVSFSEQVFVEDHDGGLKGLWPWHRPVRNLVSIQNRDTPNVPVLQDTDYQVINHDRFEKYSGMYGWALYGGVGGGIFGTWAGRMSAIMERWMEGPGRWIVTYNGGFWSPNNAGADDGFVHVTVPPGMTLAILQLVRRAFDQRGDVKTESAAGWSVSWNDLAEGDILQVLNPFIRAEV